MLLEDVGDQLGPGEVLDLVDDEPLAPHHPPPADVEHLDSGFQLVLGDAEAVQVLGPFGDHLLLLDGLAHRAEAVAEAGGALELQMVRGLLHLVLQPAQHGLAVAVEELEQLLHQGGVVGRVDGLDARSRALLDVVQQAGPALLLVDVELVVGAGADGEGAQQRVEGVADGVGVGVGAEIAVALALGAPPDHGAGPLVGHGHGQERVALVVPQPDVEAGLVLLDEAVLEHQGLDVVADLDPLDGLRRRHHLGGAGREVGRVLEVVGQARPQRRRLAHVDDPAVPVAELVGAGSVGDRPCRRALQHLQVCQAGSGWRRPWLC